jgi:precorrin-2 methylase
MKKGSLLVVGTGIGVSHLTAETRAYLASADKLLYCVADAATERLLLKINPAAESLFTMYGEDKPRRDTYDEMTARILACVRLGMDVCVAFYGHPGFFVNPSHRAIKAARDEGFEARMLPGISSLDCLICDLGIDLAIGCQIFEATDLMLRQRSIDPHGHVIILQVAALGDLRYSFKGYDHRYLGTLADYLAASYPVDHEIVAYTASHFNVVEPIVERMTIGNLTKNSNKRISTLYVPQLTIAPVHLKRVHQYQLSYLLDDLRLIPLNEPQLLNLSIKSE